MCGRPGLRFLLNGKRRFSERFLSLKRTRVLETMTTRSEAEQKSFDQDALFLQEITAGMPCANRAQSGSVRVQG
jgi:hypothetical protein